MSIFFSTACTRRARCPRLKKKLIPLDAGVSELLLYFPIFFVVFAFLFEPPPNGFSWVSPSFSPRSDSVLLRSFPPIHIGFPRLR